MVMSMKDALSVVREILAGPRALEIPRLERIDAAMALSLPDRVFDSQIPWTERTSQVGLPGTQFFQPTVTMPPSAPAIYHELAYKTHTDFLRMVVKEFAQTIKVDGYLTESDEGARGPWFWWQRNQMDARQVGLTRSVLKYGAAYVLVQAADFSDFGGQMSGAKVQCFTPRQMTAVYADDHDEWPMYALWTDRRLTYLADSEAIYVFGDERRDAAAGDLVWSASLTPIEARPHEQSFGHTPVVRYRDRWLLDGEQEFGIVEPLLLKQQHIDQIEYEKAVAQYTTAFRQRYVTGWVPEGPEQELKSNAGAVWYVMAEDEEGNPTKVDVGEFSQTDLSGYLQAGAQARRDLSAMAQISMTSLGIDGVSNTSGDAMEAMNNSRNAEASEIATSLGESHEQMLRLCAFYEGDSAAASDYESEVRWKDFNSRTYAQVVDGLTKLTAASILTPDDALDDIPGMTDQRAERIRSNARAAAATQRFEALATASGTADPTDTNPEGESTADDATELKRKFDALGVAIRAGVDPDVAAIQLGLNGIKFTGMIPVNLKERGE